MLGAHVDSWHTGGGATDNADGTTTMMEAMGILKTVDARPRRTIRVALWEAVGKRGRADSSVGTETHKYGSRSTKNGLNLHARVRKILPTPNLPIS